MTCLTLPRNLNIVKKNSTNTKQKTVSSQTQTVSSQTQDSFNVMKPKQQAAKSSNFPYWFNVVADAFVRVIIRPKLFPWGTSS